MVKAWASGFGGGVLMVIGVIVVLIGLLGSMAGDTEGKVMFWIGVLMVAGGSYLRYLSKQTVRNFSGDESQRSSASVSVAIAPLSTQTNNDIKSSTLKKFDEADRLISNDSFKLYLVNHFKVSKHEVLGKYVLEEKL
jgi:hypothetical protein